MLAIRLYNGNSSGQLTQTCPALAIKTATILELGRVGKVGRSRVSSSCKKIKKNKGQDVNQIPGQLQIPRRVASELLDHTPTIVSQRSNVGETGECHIMMQQLHSFFMTMLFFRPRLNIFIFLPILG